MAKKHRLFVAINLPGEVRAKLEEFQNEWRSFPARWVRPENVHLTLNFLGYIGEENIASIISAIETTSQQSNPFSFTLTKTIYGPPGKPPRMIWVQIDPKNELLDFQRRLSRGLREMPFRVHRENRPFSPHLTLCRFNSLDLGHLESDGLPDVETEIGERAEIRTIDLMESRLKRGGAEYSVLQSFKLR